jgi:cytochrome c-type protein NapB
VGDRVASKMSHALMTNCTQCHVEQAAVPAQTGFVGVYRAGPGERASPGAPPTIPHHTWLRADCSSCHGLVTRPGTRTTHPWLTNCTQCHAPSAALDQVGFAGDRK